MLARIRQSAFGSNVPVFLGKPITGAWPLIAADPLNFFTNLGRSLGPVVDVAIGRDRILFVTDAEVIGHVLQSNGRNYGKSRYYRRVEDIFGKNMILANGAEWHRQRKAAQPAFIKAHIETLGEMIAGEVQRLINRWRMAGAAGRPVEVMRETMQLSLALILRSLFGMTVGPERAGIIADATTVMLRAAERRLWSPVIAPLWLPVAGNPELVAALKEFEACVGAIIRERRQEGGIGDREIRDVLDAFLGFQSENGAAMSEAQVRNELMGLILAGQETTAMSIAWVLEALSRHPDVQRKLRAELADVLGSRTPSVADSARLPFCMQVIQETLRLRPPVWTISRQAIADDRVQGISIPAGTTVMMSQFVVHRRADYWPNPEGFDPDRFAQGEPTGSRRYTYFPFGGGPRKCIGQHFAVIELLIAIPMLLQNFQLNLIPGNPVELEAMIGVRPKGGLWMNVEDLAIQPLPRAA